MFKKVQLKFFGIITTTLIAIFIALLFGINIIMDVLMTRQTKVVLEQVASGVEYNSNTNSFSFTYQRKNEPDKPPVNENPEVSSKTTATESAAVTSTTTTVSTVMTSSETQTAIKTTESAESELREEENNETLPPETSPPDEKSSEPDESTEEVTEPIFTESEPSEPEFPEPWQGFPNEDLPDWQKDPNEHEWENHGQNQYPDNRFEYEHEHEVWGDFGFIPTADNDFAPVLDGYTVFDDENSIPPKHNENTNKKLDEEPVPKSFNSVDFFLIMSDNNGKYLASLNNEDLTEDTAQTYITRLLNGKDISGMTDNYSYYMQKKSNGTVMVMSDRTAEINMMNKLKRTTFMVGIISIVVLSIGAYFISGLIVRPIKYTFEKQKQFISDASHELKTPLTVISTNADVLSGEIGDNRWLNYIQDQADRMNILVNDLLSLTRIENKSSDFIKTNFNLSKAITNTALPFECQAFESNKNFIINVEDNITAYGSEQHIKQMAGIFIDNALKYSKDGGTVRVSLTKEDGKAVFSVYNTGSGVKESEKDKIFERFYRSDESRNRSTGGYGLGLAIAKSIIDKHKFKIEVENDEGHSICFIVKM